MKVSKYRPSLSACLINHILHLAKSEIPISQESIELIGILAPFQAKIKNLGITEAYITTPKKSIEEKLGLYNTIATNLSDERYNNCSSKEELWKQAYIKREKDRASCSLEELIWAEEHRYLHSLMSPEEEANFELDSTNVNKQAD